MIEPTASELTSYHHDVLCPFFAPYRNKHVKYFDALDDLSKKVPTTYCLYPSNCADYTLFVNVIHLTPNGETFMFVYDLRLDWNHPQGT